MNHRCPTCGYAGDSTISWWILSVVGIGNLVGMLWLALGGAV
jgi:hypothetical protein